MLYYMLCCLVHVSIRKPLVRKPIWWPLFYPYLPPSEFTLFTSNTDLFVFIFYIFKLHLMLALLFVSVVFLRWLFRLFILGFSISSLQILVSVNQTGPCTVNTQLDGWTEGLNWLRFYNFIDYFDILLNWETNFSYSCKFRDEVDDSLLFIFFSNGHMNIFT